MHTVKINHPLVDIHLIPNDNGWYVLHIDGEETGCSFTKHATLQEVMSEVVARQLGCDLPGHPQPIPSWVEEAI